MLNNVNIQIAVNETVLWFNILNIRFFLFAREWLTGETFCVCRILFNSYFSPVQGMDDLQVRAAATDIFSYLVEFSPSMVREFVMQEPQQTDDVSI